MNTSVLRYCALALAAFAAGFWSGCSSIASRTIGEASTKLVVRADGSAELTFPKELDARKLVVTFNPETRQLSLEGTDLKSSSQGVIHSAGDIQVQSMAQLNSVLADLLPQLLSLASRGMVQPAPAAPSAAAPPPPAPPTNYVLVPATPAEATK